MVFRDGATHFWQYVSETLLTNKQLAESVARCHSLRYCGPTFDLTCFCIQESMGHTCTTYLPYLSSSVATLSGLPLRNNRGGRTQPQFR